MTLPSVILVHGAWHGAWCWASLQAELDRRGIASLAVDLPGHGTSDLPLGDLHGDAETVVRLLRSFEERGQPAPVLVGHSYGGAVVTEAVARCPRAAHLVYVAAFALERGESVMSALRSFPAREVALSGAMRVVDGGAASVLDAETAIPALYGECPAAVAEAAVARLSPQPMATMIQEVTGSPRDSVGSTYVLCERDRAVHPDHQRIMAARCTNTVVLDTDHSPFVSAVPRTADVIEGIVRR